MEANRKNLEKWIGRLEKSGLSYMIDTIKHNHKPVLICPTDTVRCKDERVVITTRHNIVESFSYEELDKFHVFINGDSETDLSILEGVEKFTIDIIEDKKE
ncbi:hypothetical protein [Methanobrevibacter sp. DSM 116169]|uniref:hypothetical protein n=1 Tax=Methanobrevibacter sp. DSM 116169 TaxID=3242727 RepID=UPI0038FBE7B9